MMLKPIFHSSNDRDAILFKSVAIAVSVLVSGCGGGGGGDSIISTGISGRVMDGYIRGAIVFWDCNNNMRLDSGEVSTVSSEGGKYTISVPPSSACVLRAEIPGSAIDSDTGAAIGKSYTMSAINGRPGIISPLTTAVEMGAISEAQLNQYLPGVLLGSDYIALGDSGKNAHNAARFYSVLLQSIGGVIKTDDVTTRSDLIKSGLGMISSDVYLGGGDLNLYKNLLPSVSEFSLASSSLVKYTIEINDDALQGDNGSKRKVIEAAVASIKKNPQAVAGGNVYWGAVPLVDRAWAQYINPDVGVFQDSPRAQELRDIIFRLSDKARSDIEAEKKKVNKKMLAVLGRNAADMAISSLDSAIKIWPAAAVVDSAAGYAGMPIKMSRAKQIMERIKVLLPRLGNLTVECGGYVVVATKVSGLFVDESVEFSDGYSLISEAVKCGSGLLGAEVLQRAINVIDGGGALVHGSLEADALEVAKGFSDLISILCDVGGVPVVSAFWNQTAGMLIKSLISLEEINQAGGKALNDFDAAAEIIINNLIKSQSDLGAALLSARVSPYLMVIPVYHENGSLAKDGSLVGKLVSSVSPLAAALGKSTTFLVAGKNLPLTPTMTLGGIPCQIQSSPAPTASGFTAVCTPGGVVGNQVVKISDAANNVVDQSKLVSVSASVSSASKLPHTGINSGQCYAAGSDALVSCTSAGAIALSGAGKQDGMYADVTPMNYSRVGSYPLTSCVKDNVTGLIWEGKEASGTRAGNNSYTNWGDGRAGDASAFVAAVNTQALCGYTDWRLPTVDELQGLVDYSKPFSGPTINTDVFVNTRIATYYWTSSPYVGDSKYAWFVYFGDGAVAYNDRNSSRGAVRLVRASQ